MAVIERKIIRLSGSVQGVGFRPFLYNLCREFGILGIIRNTSSGVVLDIEVNKKFTDLFLSRLHEQKPRLSDINDIRIREDSFLGYKELQILDSETYPDNNTVVLPDIAACKDCSAEMTALQNRRYLYPFINCTQCGPRFTIIKGLPYDRDKTTMAEFNMCAECRQEYESITDRRFHAQPDACFKCGPAIFLKDKEANIAAGSITAIEKTAELLKKGYICAIKSIGGYQLACLARHKEIVEKLRLRKKRPAKPFALMAKNIAMVKEYCIVTSKQEELIGFFKAPVVLLSKKGDCRLPENISPNQKKLGFMVAYTPVHHLLFRFIDEPLIMTSGNINSESIIYKDDEVFEKLKGIADFFLVHNRKIHIQCDDSVATTVNLNESNEQEYLIRRARGYTPLPLKTNFNFRQQLISVGAHQKNTISVAKNNQVFMSHYLGDLDTLSCVDSFHYAVSHFMDIFGIIPQSVACDMHPEYYTTKFAKEFAETKSISLIPVQHHHAHIVSCMADNNISGEVLGISFDGAGYGTDKNIWGGEVLACNEKKFNRAAHLDYVQQPGAEAAVKNPWMMGLALLYKIYREDTFNVVKELNLFSDILSEDKEFVIDMVSNRVNSPLTSSMGRLFAGISSILGLCNNASYTGQAEISLEQVIPAKKPSDIYRFEITRAQQGEWIINYDKTIKEIIEDLRSGVKKGRISYKFHQAVIEVTVRLIKKIRQESGINRVCLSGGVFANIFLVEGLCGELNANNLEVYTHSKIPCNDSGISVGQAVIANSRMRRQKLEVRS